MTRHTECIVYRMIMARAVFHRVKAKAAVAPDFSMIASEVQNVVRAMRQQGWVIGCLYNQETDEHPQLYF